MYVRPAAPLPQRPTQKSDKNWLPWLFAGGAIFAGFAMVLLVIGAIAVFYLSQERVPDGVTVAGIDVGGRTLEDAEDHLVRSIAAQSWNFSVSDGTSTIPVSMADLGVGFDVEQIMQSVEKADKNATIYPAYAINMNQASAALIELNEHLTIPPQGDTPGMEIDIPETLRRLHDDVTGELLDGELTLSMMDIEPIIEEVAPQPEIVYDGPTTTHIVEPGQELALIAREYGVSMSDIVAMNNIENPSLIYVNQSLVIPAAGAYTPSAENAPAAPLASGKSIVVDTNTQRIFAYENGRLIRSHLTSTGRSETPTVKGDYNIYVKFVKDDMQGADYFLPDVPYTMYFYQGYGIHGTYWHNSFGRPMSHGCVNLPTEEAEWFFNWAEVGTLVRVI